MAGVKRFLIIFVVFYLIISTTINMKLGSPGMSKEYLENHKAGHDQYIESTKNKYYKIWEQRPHLVDFDASENFGLQERIDFVVEYENQGEFQKEQHRRSKRNRIFDIFNASMVVVLVTRFARKPLVGLLDGMVDAILVKLSDAEEARRASGARLDVAEHKIKGLTEDFAGYEKLVEERIENIRRDSALFTGESVSMLNKETADRKRFEEVKAKQLIKEMMVEAAITQVLEGFQADDTFYQDEIVVERFLEELRKDSV